MNVFASFLLVNDLKLFISWVQTETEPTFLSVSFKSDEQMNTETAASFYFNLQQTLKPCFHQAVRFGSVQFSSLHIRTVIFAFPLSKVFRFSFFIFRYPSVEVPSTLTQY